MVSEGSKILWCYFYAINVMLPRKCSAKLNSKIVLTTEKWRWHKILFSSSPCAESGRHPVQRKGECPQAQGSSDWPWGKRSIFSAGSSGHLYPPAQFKNKTTPLCQLSKYRTNTLKSWKQVVQPNQHYCIKLTEWTRGLLCRYWS